MSPSQRHMGRVAALGCIICHHMGLGETPAVVHHLEEDTGAAQRQDDFLTIPLCPEHHVGAGFVDWIPGPKGAVMPIPKSIAYRKLDEEGMRTFHDSCVDFLRGPYAPKVLWPHLNPADGAEMMETLMGEFA